jgi:hypothetical protein
MQMRVPLADPDGARHLPRVVCKLPRVVKIALKEISATNRVGPGFASHLYVNSARSIGAAT